MGLLPDKVVLAVEAQMVWLEPATAVVGKSSRCMLIVLVDEGHTPLLIVHANTFTPTPKPLMPVVSKVGVTMVAVPDKTVQLPVPMAGVFPFIVAVVAHTVWLGPATEAVGFK